MINNTRLCIGDKVLQVGRETTIKDSFGIYLGKKPANGRMAAMYLIDFDNNEKGYVGEYYFKNNIIPVYKLKNCGTVSNKYICKGDNVQIVSDQTAMLFEESTFNIEVIGVGPYSLNNNTQYIYGFMKDHKYEKGKVFRSKKLAITQGEVKGFEQFNFREKIPNAHGSNDIILNYFKMNNDASNTRLQYKGVRDFYTVFVGELNESVIYNKYELGFRLSRKLTYDISVTMSRNDFRFKSNDENEINEKFLEKYSYELKFACMAKFNHIQESKLQITNKKSSIISINKMTREFKRGIPLGHGGFSIFWPIPQYIVDAQFTLKGKCTYNL